MSDDTRPAIEDADEEERQRWFHELRNEIGTVAIGAAAARRLLDVDRARAADNLQRVENACRRCVELLQTFPQGPQHNRPDPSPALPRHTVGRERDAS